MFLEYLPKAAETSLYLGSGVHTVNVFVGNQKRELIVDTGSGHTAFPCSFCVHCSTTHKNPYYHPDNGKPLTCTENNALKLGTCKHCSQSNEDVCVYGEKYVEGSRWTAKKYTDKFYFDGREDLVANVAFGCIFEEYGAFENQKADGIMGMSRTPDAVFNQFYVDGTIDSPSFSQCISNEGGSMVIGGVDALINNEPMKYTPLRDTSYSYWTVLLRSVDFNGEKIPVDSQHYNAGRGCVFDSGTTFLYLPRIAEEPFKNMWKSNVGDDKSYSNYEAGKKITITKDEIQKLGELCFHLESDVSICIPPSQYLQPDPNSIDEYFTTIFFRDFAHATILGASVLRNHNILYDVKNNRIGIARANCEGTSAETAMAIEISPKGDTFLPVYEVNFASVMMIMTLTIAMLLTLKVKKDKSDSENESKDVVDQEDNIDTKYAKL